MDLSGKPLEDETDSQEFMHRESWSCCWIGSQIPLSDMFKPPKELNRLSCSCAEKVPERCFAGEELGSRSPLSVILGNP